MQVLKNYFSKVTILHSKIFFFKKTPSELFSWIFYKNIPFLMVSALSFLTSVFGKRSWPILKTNLFILVFDGYLVGEIWFVARGNNQHILMILNLFLCVQRTTEKVQFLFSRSIFLVLTKISFWKEDWALGYTSMEFWYHSELS